MSIERTVENVYLRQDAVTLTRKHFWRLLGMLLMIILCTGLLDAGLTAIGDAFTRQETAAFVSTVTTYMNSPTLTASDPVTDALVALFSSPRYLLFNLVYIVVFGIVSSGLTLGRHAQLLTAARGNKPKVLGSFCRMRSCFKAWRLSLWVSIKTILWTIPGFLCIIVGAEVRAYGQTGLGSLFILAGLGVLIALAIRAALRYCMATFILSDEPDRGVRECVTLSKGLMQSRLWQCFKLGVPMILKMLGVGYGSMLVVSIPVAVISANGQPSQIMVGILLPLMLLAITLPILYFGLQFDMVYACFYLKCRTPAAAPTSYWLQDHSVPASPALPEETPAASPEDREPENTEEKEKTNEEPVC